MSQMKPLTYIKQYATSCLMFLMCIVLCYRVMSNVPLSHDVYASSFPSEHSSPVIILDAGHGGEDCGTIGVNGVYEKDLNLKIVNMLYEYLLKEGYHTILTRVDDKLLYDPLTVEKGKKKITDLTNRVKIANQHEDAVLISIHMNSYPSETVNGLQVWYGQGEDSRLLAVGIQDTIKKDLQETNHRIPKASGGHMYLLDMTECTSVLVECGFLSNREECEKMCDENYQKELSFRIFCAIVEYIKQKK